MSSLVTRQDTGLAIHGGQSVLGERSINIPTCGSIRPGIKVLTKAGAALPGALDLYNRGVAAGAKWNVIEAEIAKRCKPERGVMNPKNVGYFTVFRDDFTMPEIADRLMSLYAEDRGEGLHLYRLPVVFPVDTWQAVLPHQLGVYRKTERVYWSEYDGAGVRVCKMHAPIATDEKSKRGIRPYGGRASVLRPENEGRCDPEACLEYQKGECKISGKMIFYVPGVPGAGAIALPLTSFYGLSGIRQQLELMSFVRGRISGLQEGGRTLFYLTKRYEEITRLNMETKRPEKVAHWITCIEADVEMTKLMVQAPPAISGPQAIAALEGGVIESDEEDLVDTNAQEVTEDSPGMTFEEVRNEVRKKVADLGLHLRDDFTPYALGKFGAGWSANPEVMGRVLDELNSIEEDGRADYIATVRKESF